DIYTKPLLPNLTFKLRQGDSLIEEIAGVPIKLRSDLFIPNNVKQKIIELADKKAAYFSGQRSADLKEKEEIEKLEKDILKEVIDSKINELQKKKSSFENSLKRLKSQKTLDGKHTKTQKKEINKLEKEILAISKEIEHWQKVLFRIGLKAKKDYFLWEIDFAEVFYQKGGFDIVIGNPPYVRQELIAPPLENQENYSDDEWREIKKQYKEKLIQSVKNIWGNNIKIDKKSDLYVYFYYHGLSLLRPGGVFCFINSNSWLDVGYGAGLQEFLLKNMKPVFIIDNLKKRSFKQSDVNTVIVLIKRPSKILNDFTLKFVSFKKPFEEVLNAEVIKKIERVDKPIFDDEDFRFYPKTKKELLEEGIEISEKDELIKSDLEYLPYIGNKWGRKYLRSPEIYWTVMKKGKHKLVKLRELIKRINRGYSMGGEKYFYINDLGGTTNVRICNNDLGWHGKIENRFLFPLFERTKQVNSLFFDPDEFDRKIFICNVPQKKLKNTYASEYINWCKKNGFLGKWNLKRKKGKILILRASADRPAVYLSKKEVDYDQTFYSIEPFSDIDEEILVALLNSSLTNYFFREIESGAGAELGQGSLWIAVYETKRIYVLNPKILSPTEKNKLKGVWRSLSQRKPESIFTELGFDPNKPIREQEPNPLPDRKALDDTIFDALGLTEEERKEVYWSVAELVKNRLEKARSV
ncbi:MAG TPA: hypothetical protein ENG63_07355, partial [Candidatus Desulfofervidus auxilii]|nr:hypothetical protein [Candidatus Desulfofervidus auxilii]